MRKSLLVAAFAAAMVTVAACGGRVASSSPVATTVVDLPPSYRFVPGDIAVSTGSTVTWTNNDNFSHSVQFRDEGLPSDPLMMEPGESVQLTFAQAGTYAYLCSLHPQNMTGSVLVNP